MVNVYDNYEISNNDFSYMMCPQRGLGSDGWMVASGWSGLIFGSS